MNVTIGDLSNIDDCKKFIDGADYVLNLAAVIPPKSDKQPHLAKLCNVNGVENVVTVIENMMPQPKLIHISTVAIYGHRDYKHLWARVGDPLLPSVYDCYSSYKLHGERCVLDSKIKTWVVLRQTAMLHNKMLTDNMSDGLMFHTCFSSPLEWVTARDSGRLLKNILKKDFEQANKNFWKKVYNIGGGELNRCTGFDTFDEGFKIIGGSGDKYLSPHWNSIRNFHGVWFFDSDILEKMFRFQNETTKDYWQEILRLHKYYKIAKIIPACVIKRLVIQRLLSDSIAPMKWIANNEKGKVKAYFGCAESAANIPRSWADYPLLSKGEIASGKINYDELKDIKLVKRADLLSHGYDETKPDSELDIDDMQETARFRGGECLSASMKKGDLYTPLSWRCHDGHVFSASPYTILKAGHWCQECVQLDVWDFDRLSKHNPFYAQVWYDTHATDENTKYWFDSKYNARYQEFKD